MSPVPTKWVVASTLAALVAVVSGFLQAEEFEIRFSTIDSGGGVSTDKFFELQATVGQPDAAVMSNQEFQLQGGFWPASLRTRPSIIRPPLSTNVDRGTPVKFTAEPVGTPPFQFQWRLNGVNLPGQTNATLELPDAQVEHGGAYTWVVANAFGIERSEPAELTLKLPTLLPGDDFADGKSIGLTDTIFRGHNVGATNEPGEPHHAGKLGGASVWYTWSTNTNGIATFHTRGSAFDTLLAVYTGNQVDALQEVDADDDRGGFLTSEVRFNVTAGTQYHIAIDGLGGRTNNFVVSWEFTPTNARLPQIEQPLSRAVPEGGSWTFAVRLTNDPAANFQWYFNDEPIVGETQSTLTIPNVTVEKLGFYHATITNAAGQGLESRKVALEIGPKGTAVSFNKFEDTLLAAQGASAAGGGGAANLRPAGGTDPSAPVVEIPTAGASNHSWSNRDGTDSGRCTNSNCEVLGGAAKWLLILARNSGVLTLDTAGSATTNSSDGRLDTILTVYEYLGEGEIQRAPCDWLIGCNDDAGSNFVSSRLSLAIARGSLYLVTVDTKNGEKGTVRLNWEFGPPLTPFKYEAGDLYLITSTNLSPDPSAPGYFWYKNDWFLTNTAEPLLPMEQPVVPASGYSVVMSVVTNGTRTFLQLTNNLGSIVTTRFGRAAEPAATGFQLILDGVTDPTLHVESFSGRLIEFTTHWLWETVTNYSDTTQGASRVLIFPVDQTDQTARIYRVRPLTQGAFR